MQKWKWAARAPRGRAASTAPNAEIRAAVVLQRAPQVLRQLTPLESTYYAYREWAARDESRPFPADLYFKKGTPSEQRWLEHEAAMDAQRQQLFGAKGGAAAPPAETFRDRELRDVERLPRTTAADAADDRTSLNRRLDVPLYLVVRAGAKAPWGFPETAVQRSATPEMLHEAARRALDAAAGTQLEAWFVGRTPMGHWVRPGAGPHVFLLKAYILSGNAGKLGSEFAWLDRAQLEEALPAADFAAVDELLD